MGDLKKAQMKISFGMIVSIILIIFFIVFSFYGIKFILDMQQTAQIAKFTDNIKEDINSAWKSQQSSREKTYPLPGRGLTHICFFDQENSIKGEYINLGEEFKRLYREEHNMFFYPLDKAGDLSSEKIEKIDIEKITSSDNPYCIKGKNGKIEMSFKKEFGENFVVIEEI